MSDLGFLHRKQDTFGKLMEPLMHDPFVTDGAKVLYAHMHWRFGTNKKNWEGRVSMADELDVSQTTITNRIGELERTFWVAVVPRDGETNFYHVFEDRDDCRDWREAHSKEARAIRDGEKRKSRKGHGGSPSHQTPQPELSTQPELRTPLNLSSHNTDSVIQTQQDGSKPAAPVSRPMGRPAVPNTRAVTGAWSDGAEPDDVAPAAEAKSQKYTPSKLEAMLARLLHSRGGVLPVKVAALLAQPVSGKHFGDMDMPSLEDAYAADPVGVAGWIANEHIKWVQRSGHEAGHFINTLRMYKDYDPRVVYGQSQSEPTQPWVDSTMYLHLPDGSEFAPGKYKWNQTLGQYDTWE